MNNDRAREFFDQGMALYEVRDYSSALKKLETALSLVGASDTQLRVKIGEMIENTKELVKVKAEDDYYASQIAKIRRSS